MAWRVAESLLQLRNQINVAAPNRSRASDGTIGDTTHSARKSDHNPQPLDGAVGVVTAMDITNDPGDACDAQTIVDALVASRDPRIKYIIWNRRIVSSQTEPWVWRDYTGKNPHNKHFHLSVLPAKALFDSKANWTIA